MTSVLARFVDEDTAQDLIEYALLSALLAVACITGILELTQILGFLEDVGAFLEGAI